MNSLFTILLALSLLDPAFGQIGISQTDSLEAVSRAADDSVNVSKLRELNQLYEVLVQQKHEVAIYAVSVTVFLTLIILFLYIMGIRQKQNTRNLLLQKNSIIAKTYADLKSAHADLKSTEAHLIELEKMVFHSNLTGVMAQEIQSPSMTIELSGAYNKIIITLTNKLLTIDFVANIVRIPITPEMTVNHVFDLVQKTLQKYESIPTKELKKVQPTGRFNFKRSG